MPIRKLILLTCLCIGPTIASGQKLPSDYWHPGAVVFINGDSVSGKIKYNFEQNIVQLTYDSRIYSYTPQKIDRFYFLDITKDSVRRYVKTYEFFKNDNYKIPLFFEVLADGKRPLLRRESVVLRTTAAAPGMMMHGFANSYRMIDYDYFYRKGDEIFDLPSRKRKLAKTFGNEWRNMYDYIKEERIKTSKEKDLIKLYNYYNRKGVKKQEEIDEEETNHTGDQ